MTGTFDGESHTGTFDSESHWATVGVLLLQVKQKCSRYRSPLPIINQSAFSHLSLMTRARPGRANRHKIYMRARRAQQNADVLGLAHPSIAAMTSNGDSIFCQPVEPESVLSLDDMFDREMRFLPYGRKPRGSRMSRWRVKKSSTAPTLGIFASGENCSNDILLGGLT